MPRGKSPRGKSPRGKYPLKYAHGARCVSPKKRSKHTWCRSPFRKQVFGRPYRGTLNYEILGGSDFEVEFNGLTYTETKYKWNGTEEERLKVFVKHSDKNLCEAEEGEGGNPPEIYVHLRHPRAGECVFDNETFEFLKNRERENPGTLIHIDTFLKLQKEGKDMDTCASLATAKERLYGYNFVNEEIKELDNNTFTIGPSFVGEDVEFNKKGTEIRSGETKGKFAYRIRGTKDEINVLKKETSLLANNVYVETVDLLTAGTFKQT